jgi:hypothetical protein
MKKESIVTKIIKQLESRSVEELQAIANAEQCEDIKQAILKLIQSKEQG